MAFKIYNELGFGLSEKVYQKALETSLKDLGLPYKREQHVNLVFQNENVGSYFLDFVIDSKIVVELKVRSKLGYTHVKQVNSYLKSSGYRLAIIIYFTSEGVKYRRFVNVT